MTAPDTRLRSGTVEPSSYLQALSRASSDAGSETPPHTAWCPRCPTPIFFSVAMDIPEFVVQEAEMQSLLARQQEA